MREMKDSGVVWIGKVPLDWEINKLKYVAPFRNQKAKENKKGYIAMENVESGTGKFVGEQYTPDGDANIIKSGDVLFGKLRPYLNKSYCVLNKGCCSGEFVVFAPNTINSEFLFYLTLSSGFVKWVDDSTYGTKMPRANPNFIKNMVIPYPNIPEQRAIASFLDRKCAAIDDSIAKHKAIIEKLEEYRKAEITRAVTKGLNPDVKMKDSGIPWIGSYPENWVLTRFKFIASVKSNLVDPTPYLQMPQIGPDIIEKDSGQLISKRTVEEAGVVSGNHLFHAGQILYSKVRPALNKVVMAPYDGLCSADMYPIETIESTKYVLYMMLSNMFLKQADIISEIRVKMPKINQDEIGDIRIVLPKRDEQDAMVKLLDDVCNKVADAIFRHNQLIAKLKEYKNSLIYNAVTGKIDCREET